MAIYFHGTLKIKLLRRLFNFDVQIEEINLIKRTNTVTIRTFYGTTLLDQTISLY